MRRVRGDALHELRPDLPRRQAQGMDIRIHMPRMRDGHGHGLQGGGPMPKDPAEVCAVWKRGDGTELVHTGIYVFDTMTIREVRELLAMYADSDLGMPYKFEI